MKNDRIVRAVEITVVLVIIVAGFAPSVQHLWNWLMPSIFGLRLITFWEALGLLGLSWLLFGGFRGWGILTTGRREDRDRLTPEQRAMLREALQKRCGFRPPAAEPGS